MLVPWVKTLNIFLTSASDTCCSAEFSKQEKNQYKNRNAVISAPLMSNCIIVLIPVQLDEA